MDAFNPTTTATTLVSFLSDSFKKTNKTKGVVAVSGGIDSAVSLTLLTTAIGKDNVYPLLLPYQNQPMDDAKLICAWNQIPKQNIETLNIQDPVTILSSVLSANEGDKLRTGNIMARVRMIAVYDRAKKLDALACGTENKSEHYLGYFTRFGDAASDIEPLTTLYKTQVRELAHALNLPSVFLEKAPSAGLWTGQTDEGEMGFSYQDADMILRYSIDEHKTEEEIRALTSIPLETICAVTRTVRTQAFKREVPYQL